MSLAICDGGPVVDAPSALPCVAGLVASDGFSDDSAGLAPPKRLLVAVPLAAWAAVVVVAPEVACDVLVADCPPKRPPDAGFAASVLAGAA